MIRSQGQAPSLGAGAARPTLLVGVMAEDLGRSAPVRGREARRRPEAPPRTVLAHRVSELAAPGPGEAPFGEFTGTGTAAFAGYSASRCTWSFWPLSSRSAPMLARNLRIKCSLRVSIASPGTPAGSWSRRPGCVRSGSPVPATAVNALVCQRPWLG
jgi:hypothetical protein